MDSVISTPSITNYHSEGPPIFNLHPFSSFQRERDQAACVGVGGRVDHGEMAGVLHDVREDDCLARMMDLAGNSLVPRNCCARGHRAVADRMRNTSCCVSASARRMDLLSAPITSNTVLEAETTNSSVVRCVKRASLMRRAARVRGCDGVAIGLRRGTTIAGGLEPRMNRQTNEET